MPVILPGMTHRRKGGAGDFPRKTFSVAPHRRRALVSSHEADGPLETGCDRRPPSCRPDRAPRGTGRNADEHARGVQIRSPALRKVLADGWGPAVRLVEMRGHFRNHGASGTA